MEGLSGVGNVDGELTGSISSFLGYLGAGVCGLIAFFLNRLITQNDEAIKTLAADIRSDRESVAEEIASLRRNLHENRDALNALNLRLSVSESRAALGSTGPKS